MLQEELVSNAMLVCSGKSQLIMLFLIMDGEPEAVNHALELEYLHALLLKHLQVAKLGTT